MRRRRHVTHQEGYSSNDTDTDIDDDYYHHRHHHYNNHNHHDHDTAGLSSYSPLTSCTIPSTTTTTDSLTARASSSSISSSTSSSSSSPVSSPSSASTDRGERRRWQKGRGLDDGRGLVGNVRGLDDGRGLLKEGRSYAGAALCSVLCLMWIVPAVCADVLPEFTEQPQSRVISHHAPVRLNCSAHPPTAQLRWLFNGKPLDVRRHHGLQVRGSNLHFGHFRHGRGRRENDGEYRCTATTQAGTVVSRTARLSRPHLGRFSSHGDVTIVVPEGGHVTLTCDPPASSPEAYVVFQGSDGQLVDTSRDWVHRLPSGNVILSNLTTLTSGDFRCVAVNPVSAANVTSRDVISVLVDPNVQGPTFGTHLLGRGRAQVMVRAGDDVTLECPTFGHGPVNVTWRKYGGSLPDTRLLRDDFGNLRILKAQYQDTGTYTCNTHHSSSLSSSSSSTFSSSSSSSSPSPPSSSPPSLTPSVHEAQVSLEVMTPPRVTVVQQPGDVSVGERVVMACKVEGSPRPKLQWFHNGQGVEVEAHGKQGDEELVLSRVSLADAGIYQCWASNVAGSDQGTFTLSVGATDGALAAGTEEKTVVEEEEEQNSGTSNSEKRRKSGRRNRKKSGRRRTLRMRGRKKKKNKNQGSGDEEKPKYAPSIPTVTQLSDRSVMLNWSVLDKGNGQNIQFFKVQYKEMSPKKGLPKKSLWQTSDSQLSPTARRFEVAQLKSGGSYKFRILAVYEDGDNKNSANTPLFKLEVQPHAQPRVPDTAPTIVEAKPILYKNNFGMGIKWQYKAESASPIEGFIIHYRPFHAEKDEELVLPGAGIRNHVIVDLKPSTFYNIRMQSFNMPGRSPFSNQVVESTKARVEPHMPHDPMAGGYNPELGMPPNQFPPEPPHDGYDGGASTDEPPSSGRRSNDTLEQPVILGIVLGALLLALAVLMAMCWWKQQQQKRRNLASNPQKFQDQSQCIYADASGHSKPNGGLYPPINGGPHMANGHGPPQDSGGHPRHGCMNIDVNPLAEYDMQTSVHGDRRPPQFYGNGLSGNSKRYGGNHSHENLTSCSGGGGGGGGKSHLQCNGGGDMAYMEQGSGGGVYPMQHRTLPLAPSQPLTTFYADSGSNSLGRPSLNHEYSEPGEREMMTATSSGIPRSSPGLPPHHHHLHQSSSSAASYNGKLSSGGGSERGGGGGLNNMMVGHRPHHAAEYDYDWSAGNSYDQPRGGGLGAGGVGGETTGALGVSSSLSQDRLPPTYHTASDFGGGSNNNINNNNNNNNNSGHMLYPPPPPPHLSSLSQQQQQLQQPSQRLTTSVSSSGSSRGHPVSAPSYPARPGLPHGGEVESRGGGGGGGGDRGGKQRRRRKRPPSRDIPPREYVMKDQATNTDLSSNEGTFEFTSYCKSGSSSNSGSEVGANGCDSNFGNNGSLESIEDSAQSASSAESDEFEPLRVTHRSVPL